MSCWWEVRSTFRLKEEYFATPSLRNLALAGGSPVTGLEIVASQPRLPRINPGRSECVVPRVDSALVREVFAERQHRSVIFPSDQDRCRRLRELESIYRSPMRECLSPSASCSSSRRAISTITSTWIARFKSRTPRTPTVAAGTKRHANSAFDPGGRAAGCACAAFRAALFGSAGRIQIGKNHA
ncbi:hypothetical protein SAMN05444158_0004 [Bradyrhizobium canariense]|uniref:Uncharacterized protein n=1 Tax=Bradyrhizobium canariense TaxID=255045 RepID=A0A1H1LYM0_9BRAD|nr:hypothetical protein SAMN05444158_0004 [Bradyrhizobium canariense]